MAKKKYTAGSPEGAAWATNQTGAVVEEGDPVELELEEHTETALIAAGWLTPETKKQAKGGAS